MSGDWLDRAAVAADARLSRRRLLVAGGAGALALGPLRGLLRAAPASAAEPCGPACIERWNRMRVTVGKPLVATTLFGVATLNPLLVSAAAGGEIAYIYMVFSEHAKCYEPNCGGPPSPPPPPNSIPPPPQPPPPPAPPPQEEEQRKNKKPKKPAKRKAGKPPPKKDSSKQSICLDLGCAAVNAACCPTSIGSFGYVCCTCCSPTGDGCKAICG